MEIRRILIAGGNEAAGRAAASIGRALASARGAALRRVHHTDPSAAAAEARSWGADLVIAAAGEPEPADAAPLDRATGPMPLCTGAPCPVLIARGGHERFAPRAEGFRRPVVGVDHSPLSEAAARAAVSLAERDGAVDLLHVREAPAPGQEISPGVERPAWGPAAEEARFSELKRLFAFCDRVDSPAVAIECHVELGVAAHQILDHIARGENDLCALGSHARATELERALGTVTEAVLDDTPVPLLVIPEPFARQQGPRGP